MKIKETVIVKSIAIKKVCLILILSLLCRFVGMSQDVIPPVTMPQNNLVTIPPTPEAAALFKFIETPVAKYTGIPNISVPVYDIKLRGLVLPIALNYHSDGYRIDEQSSDIGTGWALQAGGQLSSTVFGKSDLDGGGYKSLGTSGLFSFPSDRALMPSADGGVALNPNADYTKLMDIEGRPASVIIDGVTQPRTDQLRPGDTQPDMFYYSMFGQSGKFFYSMDGQIHPVPFSKTKITSNSVTDGYRVQDEKGNTYVFSQSEQINTTSTPFTTFPDFKSQGGTVTNYTFYLTNVYTLQGDTVTLSYNTLPYYSYRNKSSYTRYSRFPNQTSGTQDVESRVESLTEVFNSKQLSDITTNRGHKVHFTYQPCQRLDMPGRYALMKIDVYSNAKVKSFVLNQDYLNLNSYSCNTKVDSNTVKLKLKQVTETGFGNYTFSYYNEYDTFPPRFNDATDHWGYYNGKGGSPFPRDSLNGFFSGADKSPNLSYCIKGTLQKIQYPTGGYTTYNYELNQYTDSLSVPTTTTGAASVYYNADNPSQTVSFTIPSTVNPGSFVIKYNCVPNQVNPRFAVTLSGPDGSNIPFMTNPSGAGTNNSISLNPGNYTIKKVQNGVYGNGYFQITWTQTTNSAPTKRNVNGGGLRVKTIQNFSDANSLIPVHTRNFTYLSANTSFSSGQIYNKPSYYYVYRQNKYVPWSGDYCNLLTTTTTYKTQTTQSNMPLSGLQYGNVVYGEVQEYEIDNNSHFNGYTDDYYSFIRNYSSDGGHYPFTPPTNFDWKNGILLKSEVYKNNGTGYVLQKRVTNTYNDNLTPAKGDYTTPVMPNEAYAVGLNILVVRPEYTLEAASSCVLYYPAIFEIYPYKLISAWQTLASSYEENFVDGIANPITKTIQYNYDNPVHAQLTRTSRTSSDGKQYFNLTTYPNDYDASTVFISDLIKTNSVTTPIEKVEYEQLPDNSINMLNGSITEYLPGGKNQVANVYNLEINNPLPLSTYKFSNAVPGSLPNYASLGSYVKDTHYQLKASIRSYDANLNPTAVTIANGITSGYKWGYVDQNLIAICKNASDTEFFSENFENSTASGVTGGIAHTGTKYLSGNFTPNFTPPNNRSYIVQWWSLNGGNWVMNEQPYTGSVLLSGSIDDVRIFPVDAQMITNTYDILVGMTSSIDPKGLTTYYEYDSFQRLMNIKDKDGNVVKHMDYHFQGQ